MNDAGCECVPDPVACKAILNVTVGKAESGRNYVGDVNRKAILKTNVYVCTYKIMV
jgi:hypothetical protein